MTRYVNAAGGGVKTTVTFDICMITNEDTQKIPGLKFVGGIGFKLGEALTTKRVKERVVRRAIKQFLKGRDVINRLTGEMIY